MDAATISRVETGKMMGTLESHLRLMTALGAKITDLYQGIEEARRRNAVSVQSPSRRTETYVHQAGKWSMIMLTADVLQKKMMPMLLTIEPGATTVKEEAKVGTEQFLYVLEGTLEAKVDQAVHLLKQGSSLYLDASVPHHFRNTGQRTARCLSVVTPPTL